jgi:hypothetical protein
MKFKKETLQSEIRNAIRGNSSFHSNPEDSVKKLFKEKMNIFLDDISESLNKRDSEYSRVVRTIMEMKQEVNQI